MTNEQEFIVLTKQRHQISELVREFRTLLERHELELERIDMKIQKIKEMEVEE